MVCYECTGNFGGTTRHFVAIQVANTDEEIPTTEAFARAITQKGGRVVDQTDVGFIDDAYYNLPQSVRDRFRLIMNLNAYPEGVGQLFLSLNWGGGRTWLHPSYQVCSSDLIFVCVQ